MELIAIWPELKAGKRITFPKELIEQHPDFFGILYQYGHFEILNI
ncbi:hypothetical protein RINTHH_16840 [Richelia intracellularis HH01]|uniref:Uncharacterized protein n=1 Tax=Richelia intracellularis HH01 TaxID=1165094 RepID=M1WT63_9NOST|nr:hypothetical protein RINTHH_16840 [Richelia intracellularis HH01]